MVQTTESTIPAPQQPAVTIPRGIVASEITGKKVRNRAGDDLGKIHDLMVDLENGGISYAIVSYGTITHKYFAVPWMELSFNPTEDEFLWEVTRNALDARDGIDKDHPPEPFRVR
jgi:hypothetical protein